MSADGHQACRVREAVREDFAELLRLYRQLQPDDPVLEDDRDLAVFESILESPGLILFLFELDGTVRGSCYLNVIPNITRAARPYAILENVIIDEAVRGQGFGKILVGEVLAVAWSQGCYKAMLQTGSKRASTHAFYIACGFSGTDKTGYVARPD